MEYPLPLYFDTEPSNVEILDLCRGEDDYRKIYIAGDGRRRLVIKSSSNTFGGRRRVEGWFRLMEAYRRLGVYCPAVIPNRNGELLHCDTVDGRTYYTYAEEYAPYETAEHTGREKCRDEYGHDRFLPDVLRALGRVAAAGLDVLDWPSAYCLLEPFCPPDTTDEATECAELFVKKIKERFPAQLPRAEALLALFYKRQDELRAVYSALPFSCFQGDLNESNILLDENGRFAGLLDFNLCGREPVLNYAVREALWGVSDSRLFGEKDSRLYFYDRELDDLRIRLFLENIGYVQENYRFGERERAAFPILFRYMNSFWWHQLDELALMQEDDRRLPLLLDWLERQMTRDDVRLP